MRRDAPGYCDVLRDLEAKGQPAYVETVRQGKGRHFARLVLSICSGHSLTLEHRLHALLQGSVWEGVEYDREFGHAKTINDVGFSAGLREKLINRVSEPNARREGRQFKKGLKTRIKSEQ